MFPSGLSRLLRFSVASVGDLSSSSGFRSFKGLKLESLFVEKLKESNCFRVVLSFESFLLDTNKGFSFSFWSLTAIFQNLLESYCSSIASSKRSSKRTKEEATQEIQMFCFTCSIWNPVMHVYLF